MNAWLFAVLLVAVPGGGDPPAEGLAHYRAGDYPKAVEAFRAALATDPDNARLNYNLALALWRSGQADAAETAAEKAAALSKGAFNSLRDGILGNLRFDQAKALDAEQGKPEQRIPNLEKAVELAGKARGHFQRGALGAGDNRALVRNLERALQLEKELRKKLEEAKKQAEKDKKDQDKKDDKQQKDQKKGDDQKDKDKKDENKKDENKQKDDQKDQDKKDQKPDPKKDGNDPKKDDEQRKPPEPDPKSDKKEPEPGKDEKSGEKKTPEPDEKKNDKPTPPPPAQQQAPGEHDPNKELSPEERHKLLKQLQKFEASLKQLKAARQAARPKVKKDW